MRVLLAAAVLALGLAGCGGSDSPAAPGAGGPVKIDLIQVDSVDVLFLASAPVAVGAHVQGVVGDGCSELLPIRQSRAGNAVTIRISRQRPANAVCTQIAKLFDATIRLEGAFPPGSYTLDVNGVDATFQVP